MANNKITGFAKAVSELLTRAERARPYAMSDDHLNALAQLKPVFGR